MNRILTAIIGVMVTCSVAAFDPQSLWQQWPEIRFEKTTSACLQPDDLQGHLDELSKAHEGRLQLQLIGESVQGRPIRLLRLGEGGQNILLWSQMHGDEPSATPALLDIADYLLTNSDETSVQAILEKYTLLMIPMLNPDGAVLYQRYNAQGIDINRDALQLSTPEGRLLKQIRDRYQPVMGFNLHDQGRRTAVGDTGKLATNSVLSVSGDEANTLTPGRIMTKRAATAVVEALAPFMPGGVARYDEDWSPRAFGDNLTAWGTPVLLIESGGLPPGHAFSELTRLNFVAILSVLKGMAESDLSGHDPAVYENLPRNRSRSWSDMAVRGGWILQPGTRDVFRADVVFDLLRSDQQLAACARSEVARSSIVMVGDASLHATGDSVDASGKLVLPSFDAGLNGWEKHLWVNQKNLLAWAALGVGTVYWAVEDSHSLDAMEKARSLVIPGGPAVVVISDAAELPGLELKKAPSDDLPSGMEEVFEQLGVRAPKQFSDLDMLWKIPEKSQHTAPRLRRRAPASFLLLSHDGKSAEDIRGSQVAAVWLNGVKVR